jgi:hypothetical protein
MPAVKTKKKTSRSSKAKSGPAATLTVKEVRIKRFVDGFYQRYGKMMSKLSHE